MLKLSTKSTYAIKALVYLASRKDRQPQNLMAAAENQGIPHPYLEQIFSKLKKAGIVKAVRGPRGGFQLARAPETINLAEIIAALEGAFEPVLCSYPENRSDNCHEVAGCLSRSLCNELDGTLLHVLTGKTLQTMLDEAVHLHDATAIAIRMDGRSSPQSTMKGATP